MITPLEPNPSATQSPQTEPSALRVRDWAVNHETGHTRRRKSALPWVCLPTAHDSNRYRRLTRLARGVEIFAAWCLLLAIAAKSPRRGVLLDEQGQPLNSDDLAGMTGFASDIFNMAIEALLDVQIAWLERVPLSTLKQEWAAADAIALQQTTTRKQATPRRVSPPPRTTDGIINFEPIDAPLAIHPDAPDRWSHLDPQPQIDAAAEAQMEDDRQLEQGARELKPIDPEEIPEFSTMQKEALASKASAILAAVYPGTPAPDLAELHRQLKIVEILTRLHVDPIPPEFLKDKRITMEKAIRIWNKIKKDPNIGNHGTEMVFRLKQLIT